jgi:predicted TIM-barrel fold metal-dependent hydrolase
MADYDILDIHHHVGRLNVADSTGRGFDMQGDQAQRTTLMDAFGIRAAAVMPSLQYERPNGARDTAAINDLVAAYRDSCRDRFPVAIGTVEPLHGIDAGISEINRMATQLHMSGVVWHHRFQGTWIADPRMVPFLAEMERLGLPAFIHVFAESNLEALWGLEQLAEKFPQITFIAVDAFSGLTRIRELKGLGARCTNIMFETAAAFPMGSFIEEFVELFGSERILYGSDVYSGSGTDRPPHVLTMVLKAKLDEQDRRNILWNNAQRLFGLSAG